MECEQDHSPSFRRKLKITSVFCGSSSFSCDCDDDECSKPLRPSSSDNHIKAITALSSWLKSELPEIKGLFSGKIIARNRRRSNSTEFKYDPLSYALNFEDEHSRFDGHQYPLRDFSSRFPPSPPSEKKNVVVCRQIAACS